MDIMTPIQRRKTMQSIRSKDTKPEILLRKALWTRGYRNYRKNFSKIIGKPDIVFIKSKIAIFVDSEFFHGYNWEQKKTKIDTNREYWIRKIEKNVYRDKQINAELLSQGWIVLRFWQHEITKNPNECVEKILYELSQRKQ